MKTPHKHAEKIKLWADGYTIQFLNSAGEWEDTSDPGWMDGLKYRVKPPEDPYQHLKEAHARGEQIELLWAGRWISLTEPGIISWVYPVTRYRIAKKGLPPKQPYSQESWQGTWVRWKSTKTPQAVLAVHQDYILIADIAETYTRTYGILMEDYEWSTSPNGPWNPCYL